MVCQAGSRSALVVIVGWPALATILESTRAMFAESGMQATGTAIDSSGATDLLRETAGLSRPARLARETIGLVAGTELIALPLGIVIAFLLFRTDIWGRFILLGLVTTAAFVPLPLHATAWLGAFGNAGRSQALGMQPILVGRLGAAVVHGLAILPWVVLIVGVGLAAVESELEESALLELPGWRVVLRVSLRRAVGAIAAAALAGASPHRRRYDGHRFASDSHVCGRSVSSVHTRTRAWRRGFGHASPPALPRLLDLHRWPNAVAFEPARFL